VLTPCYGIVCWGCQCTVAGMRVPVAVSQHGQACDLYVLAYQVVGRLWRRGKVTYVHVTKLYGAAEV
jgi:hypothetical protein